MLTWPQIKIPFAYSPQRRSLNLYLTIVFVCVRPSIILMCSSMLPPDSGFSLMTGLSSLLPLNKTRYTVLHNVCSITLTTTQALSPLYDFLSLPFSLPTCSWCNLSICKSNSPVFFNILILTFLLYMALWGPIQITLSIIYTHFHGHNKLETQLWGFCPT